MRSYSLQSPSWLASEMSDRLAPGATAPIGLLLLIVAGTAQELAFSVTLHLPGHLLQRGISEVAIGVVFGLASVLSLGLRPALGRLLDTVDERVVWRILLLALVASLCWLASTNSVGPIVVGTAIVQVCGVGLYTTAWYHAARSLPPEQRSRGFALFGVASTLPILVGGAGGDFVVRGWGYRGLFLASIVLACVTFLVTWLLPRTAGTVDGERRGVLKLLGANTFRPIWMLSTAASLGMLTVFTFGKTFSLASDVTDTVLTFGVIGAVALCARLVSYRLAERFSVATVAVLATVCYAAGLVVFVRADGWVWLIVGLTMTGAGHGVVMPLLSVLVVGTARSSEVGSALSSMTSLIDLTWLVGAPAVGLLVTRWDYSVAFSVAAGAMMFLVVSSVLLARRDDATAAT